MVFLNGSRLEFNYSKQKLAVVDEELAGMGMGMGRVGVRVNIIFKLWTIYLWLSSQFRTIQYVYVANLRCMTAQ